MSLYADEDLTSTSLAQTVSENSTPAAAADPLKAFEAAIVLPGESPAQAAALVQAAQRFEAHPEALPTVCAQLLPMVVDGGEEGLLRAWTLEMVDLAVGRGGLSGEVKLKGEICRQATHFCEVDYSVAQSSLDALNKLVHSTSVSTLKAVIPIFSTIHPILFKLL
jgi:symplekin